MAASELDQSDIQGVLDVLRSGRLALGPQVEAFEQAMAEYVGVRHAVAVNSGTAALHLIVRALGLGPGDEVLVPSFTFAASVNVLLYEGVRPVFVDITPDTYNLDPEELERRRTPRTRAVMVVDVFGHPAPWTELQAFAERHGLALIDDCCEALGSRYRGIPLGQLGDAGAFAFYPNKQITTGEGGMVVTNRDDLADLARSMRNQGRGQMGAWLEHERLGYNYRLPELSAALGVTQLARLDAFVAARSAVAARYDTLLQGLGTVTPPVVRPEVDMSYFVYVVTLQGGLHRDRVMEALQQRGVPSRGYFAPLHQQPYLRELLGEAPDLPVTQDAARRTLALPFHTRLGAEDAAYVVQMLREVTEQP
ncbi:DegT/DnrJ/EryC1/StrS family aminotransferase [Deinococcus sp. SDU3-2]|uniref:DegT/DnrJ/EryC1/StrS family aminotransferase n=2 Tax=Deinococcus terrestris TaxID=2651870 RepID=A0A7X1TSN3_9DEIO|nr:DegT/DnrJ/EryC1/StrS family aminotransferase [Deinococcus terrestris]